MNPSNVSAIRSKSPCASRRSSIIIVTQDEEEDSAFDSNHNDAGTSESSVGPRDDINSFLLTPTGQSRHVPLNARSSSSSSMSKLDSPNIKHRNGSVRRSQSTSQQIDSEPVDAFGDNGRGDGRVPAEGVASDPEDTGEMLRRKLAFFFLNPVDKYHARKQLPWKLLLQFLKIVLVTVQIIIFGNYRYAHTNYYADGQIALQHLFLKNWDAVREIHAYPPATGAYAIYRKQAFYEYFDFIADQYLKVEELSVNPFFRNSSFDFCIETFAEGHVFPNLTWSIDFDNLQIKTKCLSIPEEDLVNFNSSAYLQNYSPINWDTLMSMKINFTMKTLTYVQLGPTVGADCFAFHTTILFDNKDYDGQILVSLDIDPHRQRCPHPQNITGAKTISVRFLNYIVIFTSFLSLVLCCRALVRGQLLRHESETFFKARFGWILTSGEKLDFLNGWYIVICVNDILIIIGSVIKEMIESRNTLGDLWDFCSLFLGCGNLLVWVGMLRYLGFFQTYNVLILTMKGALPNVMRFLLCGACIYLGFVFCGWIILGPYHFKFKTVFTTSECLFSLINGDDMFATFSSLPENRTMIWVFSRVYLYIFIGLFVYIILSLFIAIIMDTYDIIKEYYKDGWPKRRLHEFYKQANYEPKSGVFRNESSLTSRFVRRLMVRAAPRGSQNAYENLNPRTEVVT